MTRSDLFTKFSWPTSRAKQREATEFRILGQKLTKIQRKCERRFFSPKLARLLPPKTSLFRWKAALSSRRPKLASVYKEHMLSVDYWIVSKEKQLLLLAFNIISADVYVSPFSFSSFSSQTHLRMQLASSLRLLKHSILLPRITC